MSCSTYLSVVMHFQAPALSLGATLDGTEAAIDTSVLIQESFSTINIRPEAELNANLLQFPKCYVR